MEPRRNRPSALSETPISVSQRPVLLIDGNCLAYQALYTTGDLSHKGQPTGVIFGFLTRLYRIARDIPMSTIAIAWDSPKSFRKERFPWYKAGRHRGDDPVKQAKLQQGFAQFNQLQNDILPQLGLVNQWNVAGFEADDLLAAYAIASTNPSVIVTSDEDLWQAIRPTVTWYNPTTRRRIGLNELRAEGVRHPSDWAMAKAIAGCPSDKVPGVEGVGPKTALRFIYREMKSTKHDQNLEQRIRDNWMPVVERNLYLVRLPYLGTPVGHPVPVEPQDLDFADVCERFGLDTLLPRAVDWCRVLSGQPPTNQADFDGVRQQQKRDARDRVKDQLLKRVRRG